MEGGHGLGDENVGQFVDVMVNQVLAETYPGRRLCGAQTLVTHDELDNRRKT